MLLGSGRSGRSSDRGSGRASGGGDAAAAAAAGSKSDADDDDNDDDDDAQQQQHEKEREDENDAGLTYCRLRRREGASVVTFELHGGDGDRFLLACSCAVEPKTRRLSAPFVFHTVFPNSHLRSLEELPLAEHSQRYRGSMDLATRASLSSSSSAGAGAGAGAAAGGAARGPVGSFCVYGRYGAGAPAQHALVMEVRRRNGGFRLGAVAVKGRRGSGGGGGAAAAAVAAAAGGVVGSGTVGSSLVPQAIARGEARIQVVLPGNASATAGDYDGGEEEPAAPAAAAAAAAAAGGGAGGAAGASEGGEEKAAEQAAAEEEEEEDAWGCRLPARDEDLAPVDLREAYRLHLQTTATTRGAAAAATASKSSPRGARARSSSGGVLRRLSLKAAATAAAALSPKKRGSGSSRFGRRRSSSSSSSSSSESQAIGIADTAEHGAAMAAGCVGAPTSPYGALRQRDGGRGADLLFFRNQPPSWDEERCAWVMDFSGRAKRHSPLNFVLELDEEHMLDTGEYDAGAASGGGSGGAGGGLAEAAAAGAVFFRLGKLAADEFALDFRAPFSPLVALAVACSAFVRNAKMPV